MVQKVWIDCDAGTDDAMGIFMVLANPHFEIVGISTVRGNTYCDQVALNVLRVLQVAGHTEVPVYRGCKEALLGNKGNASEYHGLDGLGDVPDSNPPNPDDIQSEHAVIELIKMVQDSDGEIILVCLGPLTNIAMAIRLYPEFGQHLKACYIMGGNYQGRGNVTMTAEFNFWTDPEAAFVVLSDLKIPITMACWELCLHHSLSLKWYHEEFSVVPTDKGRFIRDIEAKTMANYYENRPLDEVEYEAADQLIIAILLSPKIVRNYKRVHCTVELAGGNTRGQMICDWKKLSKMPPNVNIVTGVDIKAFKEMLIDALH